MDLEMSAGQKIGIFVSFVLFLVIVWIIASFAKGRR